ncbi:ankyrin repeat domain-containing protein [Coralliovum pocilloporae]|uniref:ankyrin repeat domain-containing protein n=1 Tax=Coralliovum pocilloporae TaxID=3066369 RepID=UPI003306B6A3
MVSNIISFNVIDNLGNLIKDFRHDIIEAAYYGDLDGIKQAVAENPACVHYVDEFTGKNALHFSAGLGNYSCAKYLVDHTDIDVNAEDKRGETALLHAARIGHDALGTMLMDKMNPYRHESTGKPPSYTI